MFKIYVLVLFYIFFCVCEGTPIHARPGQLQFIRIDNNNDDVRSELYSNFEYFDGQSVFIECLDPTNLIFKMNDIVLYEAVGKVIIKLTSEHDGAVLQCLYTYQNLTLNLKLGPGIPEEHIIVNGIAQKPHQSVYYMEFREDIIVTFNYNSNMKFNNCIVVDNSVIEGSDIILPPLSNFNDDRDPFSFEIQINKISHLQAKSFNISLSLERDYYIMTQSFILDIKLSELNFDPFFADLNLSKRIARYRESETHGIIQYQLDSHENMLYLRCLSFSGDTTIDGRATNRQSFKLETNDVTLLKKQNVNCTSHYRGQTWTTTLVLQRTSEVTQQQTSTVDTSTHIQPTSQKGDNGHVTEVQSAPANFKQTPAPCKDNGHITVVQSAPADFQQTPAPCKAPSIVGALVVTVFVTILITILISGGALSVYLKKYPWRPVATDSPAEELERPEPESEQIYEDIDYATCKSVGKPTVDFANKAQLLTKPEENEEKGTIYDYNYPYDHRVNWVPKAHGRGRGHLASFSRQNDA